MSWQQLVQQLHTPFLQGLRQDSMIGIGEGIVNDIPSCFLIQMFLINHDSQQLNNAQRWMCVIELNWSFIGEVLPLKFTFVFLTVSLVSTDDVLQRGWDEQVLLFQSQLLSLICRIVGVEHAGNVLRLLSGLQCLVVIATVECHKVELIDRHGLPQSQTNRVEGCIPRNWCIISSCQNGLSFFPIRSFIALVIDSLPNFTTEVNFILNIDSLNFPWIAVLKPIIWDLYLAAVFDNLPEDAVLITNTVAPRRVVQRCQWVQKAGRQSA